MMKPMLCFKVYLCEQYEDYLREFGDDEQIKAKFEDILRTAFEDCGVRVDDDEFACRAIGHRGGIE